MTTAPTSPHLILIHCHDLGRFLGCYGVDTVSTPHLDRFATEAVVFDRAFAASPTCSPARASLFTGLQPARHGVLGLTHDPFGWDLRDRSHHLAQRLRRHGYRSELVGVHHESRVLDDERVAHRLGFDRVRSGGGRDVVAERACAAIDAAASADRPSYLQIGFSEPHRVASERDERGVMGFLAPGVEPDRERGVTVPAHLCDDEATRAELAELQGAVRFMDEGVGRVLDHLRRSPIAGRTVVVFTTDHGLALPRAKCTLYDAGLGVALMIAVPGRRGWSGRRIDDLAAHVDVVPTLFELAGLGAPDEVDGTSLVGLVEAGEVTDRTVFGQQNHHIYADPKRSVRTEHHKLIANLSTAPGAMDPTQSWTHRSSPSDLRLPAVAASRPFELYDLRTDPDELHDELAGPDDPLRHPAFADLAGRLWRWMHDQGDPVLDGPPATPRHAVVLDLLRRAATDTGHPDHPIRPTVLREREPA